MLSMPRGHSPGELEQARALVRHLGSADLHVFWSDSPVPLRSAPQPSRPPVPALLRGLAALGAVVEAAAAVLAARRV